MNLNLKYQTDETFLKKDNRVSEIFIRQNNAPATTTEDSGSGKTARDRMSQSGPVRTESVQHTSACPWPKTCGCGNK
jgi:hypothetical protein